MTGKGGPSCPTGLHLSIFIIIIIKVSSEPYEDRAALLDFLDNIHHTRPINWNLQYPVCTSWIGITCNHDQTSVTALRLPGVGFSGAIPSNTLSRLTSLRTLSLRSNAISGPFPPDLLLKLRNLTFLHLQSNHLSGPLLLPSSDFAHNNNNNNNFSSRLSVLNLSSNRFTGSISPSFFKGLKKLTSLDLSRNSLSGDVGELDQYLPPGLKYLNLSDNRLHGSVPGSLRKRFPASSFSGNTNVEYYNTPTPSSSPPTQVNMTQPPPPAAHKHPHLHHLSETAILGMVIGGCSLLFIIVAVYIVLYCSNNKENDSSSSSTSTKKQKSSNSTINTKTSGSFTAAAAAARPITFFEGSTLVFDLEDLLSASAEVLGKGTYGTTYKAALEESTTVVVKRLKQVSVGRKEFEQQMEGVGRMKQHENVAALRAYYYSKDEKLLVYDYFLHGSVSALLHGKGGGGNLEITSSSSTTTTTTGPLDWDTRLRIAIGAARGLAHIHSSNKVTVHGNIKSSNILLNTNHFGCVSDLGLATIVTPPTPPPIPVRTPAGYRAPELTSPDPRKATQASDVYSFGVFLLELLTGKSPLGEGVNLVKWVNSVVREEWTAEVFDVDLLRYSDMEEEMVQMLQLGLTCAAKLADQRPRMVDVVRLLEDVRRGATATSAGSTPNSTLELGSTSYGLH